MHIISEEEYRAKITSYLDAYQAGLNIALSEIEADENETAQALFRTWQNLKSDCDKRMYGDNVARQILAYTGRAYLYKRLPSLGDFV